MTTQNRCLDEDDRLWFFMSRRSESIRELERQAVVNVSHSDPGKDSYVSVSGTARVVDDKNRLKALWSKKAEAWFPGGVDDPDLALVEVQISHAHYWDVTDNHLVQLYKMAKAAVTGEPPHDMTHLGEVRMR